MNKLAMVENVLMCVAFGPLIAIGVSLLGMTVVLGVVQTWQGDPGLLLACIMSFSGLGAFVISLARKSENP